MQYNLPVRHDSLLLASGQRCCGINGNQSAIDKPAAGAGSWNQIVKRSGYSSSLSLHHLWWWSYSVHDWHRKRTLFVRLLFPLALRRDRCRQHAVCTKRLWGDVPCYNGDGLTVKSCQAPTCWLRSRMSQCTSCIRCLLSFNSTIVSTTCLI
jgi:hypothetical protein